MCFYDAVKYIVYYSATQGGDFTPITTINDPNDTTFLHTNISTIAGCYAVVSVDSVGNVSQYSNEVCLDINICNIYSLPNVFSPNGDGFNDLFVPFPYDFVEKIDMNIYNRWGKVVFHTTDPNINWNGKDQKDGIECADGVYYYVCDVWEHRLGGLTKRTITGFIHLLR